MASDSFLTRWSKRKIEGGAESEQEVENEIQSKVSEEEVSLTLINEDSVTPEHERDENDQPQSIASLLASQAAKETKKAALRKLFLSGEFSEVDRLNDYDHDYSSVKPLATEVAQQLREWLTDTAEELDEQSSHEPVIANQSQEAESQIPDDEVSEQESLQLKSETKNTI